MKLQLDRTHVLALAGQFPALSEGLQDPLRFSHRVELRSHTLPLEALLPAVVRYLAHDSARGWWFAANVAGKQRR